MDISKQIYLINNNMRVVVYQIIIFIFVLNSCICDLASHGKKDKRILFSEYLNDIKNDNLPNELQGYNYMSLRDINSYRLEFPDGMVIMLYHNNCNIKIKRCIQSKTIKYLPEKEVEEKTIEVLHKLLKYNNVLLETNDFRFKIRVNKKCFIQNSLPFYDTKNKRPETNVVLVFLYRDTLQDSIAKKVLEYYNPIHVDEKCYYYEE